MTLGGRPQKDGGREQRKFWMNRANRTAIDKIESGSRSDFVNRALGGPLRALDPGTSCKDVSELNRWFQGRMSDAQRNNDYARVQVIAMWQESIKPELQLCELEKTRQPLVENRPKNTAPSIEPGAAIIDFLKTAEFQKKAVVQSESK